MRWLIINLPTDIQIPHTIKITMYAGTALSHILTHVSTRILPLIRVMSICTGQVEYLVCRASDGLIPLRYTAHPDWRNCSIVRDSVTVGVSGGAPRETIKLLIHVVRLAQLKSCATLVRAIHVKNMIIKSCWCFHSTTLSALHLARRVNHNLASL